MVVVRYIKNVLVALSQFGNALLAGDPDETISGRVGRRWPDSWAARIINGLFFWQKNHVVEAIEEDEGKHDIIR